MNRDTLCTPVFAFFDLFALIAFVIVLFQRLSSLIALAPYISPHPRFLRSVLSLLSFWLLRRSNPQHISTYNPALHRLYGASASAPLPGHSTS
jgi:hypothetical protein